MKFFFALLLTVNLAPSGVQAKCNTKDHHHVNNGYYVEGIAGVDNVIRDKDSGKRADLSDWVKDKYYPHGEMKKCTGMFCSQQARDVGTKQYVVAHTCALLRFTYANTSGSTVYEMPDETAFTNCDFSQATLRGAADKGTPHYDYVIEDDHVKKIYYFASKDNCATGQKVAVQVGDDYVNNAKQCKAMGRGSSRIQHCDCRFAMNPSTLIEPCHSAFVAGCEEDAAEDPTCCPVGGSYANRKYTNGGTCVAKSKDSTLRQVYAELTALCKSDQKKCDDYESLPACPSRFAPGGADPKCDMYKAWKKCEKATGSAVEECTTEIHWIMTQKIRAPPSTQAKCNTNDHHPVNNGYYVEGIAGVDNNKRDAMGKRADVGTWAKDRYYPHGEIKKCTGQFCSKQAREVGTPQYVIAHTCSLIRFTYAADSGHTVYRMPDKTAFDNCDFRMAVLVGAKDKGTPHYDFVIESDHDKKIYYFASKDNCASWLQKVAVQVVDDYANNAKQCKDMGKGSSRIQHCDCNFQYNPSTLIEPCHSAFQAGCMADMPTDTSCCPVGGSYANRMYKNGGTCVAKSKDLMLRQVHANLTTLCQSNKKKCDEYKDLEKCPGRFSPGGADPKCDMYKSWKKCENATKSAAEVEECRTDVNWIMTKKIQKETNPSKEASDAMNALPFALGLLLTIIGALR